MKKTLFVRTPVWLPSCLVLLACELPPAEPPGPSETPPDSTEVTVTETEPEPLPEPTPTSEPEPASPPPPKVEDGVTETDEQTRGRLPPAKIAPVLQAHGGDFNQCYAKALAARPSLGAGTVTLLIVISPEGSVPHAEVVDARTTLESPEVHACLIDEAKTLQFDKPVGGRVVTQYPLEFKPTPP